MLLYLLLAVLIPLGLIVTGIVYHYVKKDNSDSYKEFILYGIAFLIAFNLIYIPDIAITNSPQDVQEIKAKVESLKERKEFIESNYEYLAPSTSHNIIVQHTIEVRDVEVEFSKNLKKENIFTGWFVNDYYKNVGLEYIKNLYINLY